MKFNIEEIKEDIRGISTKELVSYKKMIKLMSILFTRTSAFIILLLGPFGVAMPIYLTTGNTLILFIALSVHFILFRISRSLIKRFEIDGKECKIIHKLIKDELVSR